jgi:hypothetical protein
MFKEELSFADGRVRDPLEILDGRYDRKSALIACQPPINQWHAYRGDRTLADAILDSTRAQQLSARGESMRRHKAVSAK